jgi:hypothetical protein
MIDESIIRMAKISLWRKAGKRPPLSIEWEKKGKHYKITRRVGVFVYVKASCYGQRVRGLSIKYRIADFVKEFTAI